jgi:hypothetical protein
LVQLTQLGFGFDSRWRCRWRNSCRGRLGFGCHQAGQAFLALGRRLFQQGKTWFFCWF